MEGKPKLEDLSRGIENVPIEIERTAYRNDAADFVVSRPIYFSSLASRLFLV